MNKSKPQQEKLIQASAKRSLLYSNQKASQPLLHSTSPISQRSKTPTDFKSQTLRLFPKAGTRPDSLKPQDLSSLQLENHHLLQENEKLQIHISSLAKSLEELKSHNKDLVKALVDVIQVFTESGNHANSLRSKLLLEVKTTLVSKLEQFTCFNLDYKQQIEQVSLWGTRTQELEHSRPQQHTSSRSLHPLNPLNSLKDCMHTSQSAKALFNFKGELVIYS